MASLTRRTKRTQQKSIQTTGTHYLVCKVCGIEELEASLDISAITCGRCVMKMVAPPVAPAGTVKSDKPRGWHFKAYFEHEGKVYSRGEEITDRATIRALKKEHSNPTVRGNENASSSE
jgi:hypothetical protein